MANERVKMAIKKGVCPHDAPGDTSADGADLQLADESMGSGGEDPLS